MLARLIAFAFIWSSSILLMFVGVRAMPATTLVTARAIVAAVFVLIFFGRFSGLEFDRASVVLLGLAGILGVTIAPLFQVIRQYSYAPSASDIVFILNLAPVFIVIGSLLFFEKATFEKIVGTTIALLGMVCILANWEQPSSFAPFFKFLNNEVWMLGSALAWAGFTLIGKKLVEKYEPTIVVSLVIGIGTVPLIFASSVDGSISRIVSFNSLNWLLIAVLGIFGTGIATVIWYKALVEVEASKVASIMFVAPLLITVPTLIERNIGIWGITPMMTLPVIVGCVLVIVGIAVVWKKPSDDQRVSTSE